MKKAAKGKRPKKTDEVISESDDDDAMEEVVPESGVPAHISLPVLKGPNDGMTEEEQRYVKQIVGRYNVEREAILQKVYNYMTKQAGSLLDEKGFSSDFEWLKSGFKDFLNENKTRLPFFIFEYNEEIKISDIFYVGVFRSLLRSMESKMDPKERVAKSISGIMRHFGETGPQSESKKRKKEQWKKMSREEKFSYEHDLAMMVKKESTNKKKSKRNYYEIARFAMKCFIGFKNRQFALVALYESVGHEVIRATLGMITAKKLSKNPLSHVLIRTATDHLAEYVVKEYSITTKRCREKKMNPGALTPASLLVQGFTKIYLYTDIRVGFSVPGTDSEIMITANTFVDPPDVTNVRAN